MKDDDLYCYATVSIESHGYIIKTGHEHARKIGITTIKGEPLYLELLDTNGHNSANIRLAPNDVDKLIIDPRAQDGRHYVVVYRADKSEAEVLALIHPQLRERMRKLVMVYEKLAENAQYMLYELEESCTTEMFCPPMSGPI